MAIVHVAATLSTGQVAIMQFLTRGVGPNGVWEREPTVENIEAELERAGRAGDGSWRDGFPVTSWRTVPPETLPQDRRYRAAWRDDGDKVDVDLPVARDLRLEALRAERAAVLPDLDVEWMKAQGQGRSKEASDIEAKRQRLRDMPTLVDAALEAAKNADDLDAISLPV